jgi:hypothetical protein
MFRSFLGSALWIIANGGQVLGFGSKASAPSVAHGSVDPRAAVHPEVVGNGTRRLRRFNLITPSRHGLPGRFSHPDAEAG